MTDDVDIDELLTRTREEMADLEDSVEEGSLEDAIRTLRQLIHTADEVEDVVDAVDVSELPDAVDGGELLKAIEAGEVPDAVRDGELGDAVDYRQLLGAVELREMLGATDLRRLWKESQDLDFGGESDDSGILGDEGDGESDGVLGSGLLDDSEDAEANDAEDDVIAELEGLIAEDDGDEDDGFVESATDALTGDADDAEDDGLLGGSDAGDSDGGLVGGDDEIGFDEYDQRAVQMGIQSKAMDAVDEFRAGMLEAHEKLKKVYEKNQQRTSNRSKGTSSRNPTAVRTIQNDRGDIGHATHYSTIPRETRYSTAPNRKRIYGSRFDQETGNSETGESDG
ncbi:hypothetical protein SAMN04488063_2584 [Halopelagius inordinatus]|uniref:Uncharacterized protein n=1 Tax=Halopelagius inordinatus TaxID=553467 RepID=A0A1I2TGJ4_9EURY|nr:hypothetical protein [Halopelagius inordinatus]SFG61421.1 hypothetical protein SAMN04488063_2584 [Halopelagius inordinatus]